MTRSVPLVLLILASAFLSTTCATKPMLPPPTGPCAHPGTPDPHAPLVCVHDGDLSNISASPDPAHAYKGATIQFFTDSGSGTLAIASSTLPVDSITCIPGQGHCTAKVRDDAGAANHKYYAIVTQGSRVGVSPDPTIIIDTD